MTPKAACLLDIFISFQWYADSLDIPRAIWQMSPQVTAAVNDGDNGDGVAAYPVHQSIVTDDELSNHRVSELGYGTAEERVCR